MNANEYQMECLRTEAGMNKDPNIIDSPTFRLLNGLMGLNGEAGEAIDILKKHLFQGHELDLTWMASELGDCLWYIAISADAIGYDLEKIMQMNKAKLRARYPDGFKAELSIHRKEGDI